MANTIVQIRMDSALKDQAAELFEDLGLALPTAIRIFLKKSIAFGGIPFEVQRDIPNETTRRAISNAEQGIGLSRPFHSVEELMADLNADDPL